MQSIVDFIQANKPYFEAAHIISSIVNILGWGLGAVLLTIAWRRNSIRSFTVGPVNFQLQQAAVEATAVAARDWQAKAPGAPVDVARIRATVGKAFAPDVADNLIGKAILWVDDNPSNNWLAVRALGKLQLDVVQETSTERGLEALRQRHFDLVISDMGRGTEMRAGYDLLKAIRDQGSAVPFLIFAGDDKPEYRREAAERGAQLSTNDMLELVQAVIEHLGKEFGRA
jgi:CheY-like chemotaxis protein